MRPRVRDSVTTLALTFEESCRGVLVEVLVSDVVVLIETGAASVLGARGGKRSHQERDGARSSTGQWQLVHVDRNSTSDRPEWPALTH